MEGITCIKDGCPNQARYRERHLCQKHYKEYRAQFKEDLGDDRVCATCGERKNWRRFIRREHEARHMMCSDCWRAHLSREFDVTPSVGKGQKKKTETPEQRWEQFVSTLMHKTG